ncbi:MAG: 16S rRNA (cytidine(1402)-2'-O)-methyltransferase [Tissierellia bacterium]|nr:16S rRNA (cytidine(1402)-2'-O)-methyltransferase [Tissierellia bacterium]
MEKKQGRVIFCPTPIGNLGDISLRTIKALRAADRILCEDTRHSGLLLKHLGISKPLVSYHDHNEKSRTQEVLNWVREGQSLALVTDAGMPGVSDPGGVLIGALQAEGLAYEVLPGPTAVTTAVVHGNMAQGRYLFWGFLPAKKGERDRALEGLKACPVPLVFYEGPHRIMDLVASLHEVLGDREVVFARELTKKFEEILRTRTGAVLDGSVDLRLQGEFVVLVEGAQEEVQEIDIRAALRERMAGGMKKSQAVKEVAKTYKLAKNQVYQESLEIE